MEKKINIAKLLKDCPKGMELYCMLFENVKFNYIKEDTDFPIRCFIENENSPVAFNKYGQFNIHNNAKCVIFPKGKTSWEGFVPPIKFKDGDVVATTDGSWIGITTGGDNEKFIPTYCVLKISGEIEIYFDYKEKWYFNRFATEEEKRKLFQVIKDNGYKWNAETKTLEKLVPNKFDITTLKAFESRVLVRDKNTEKWIGHFFSHYDNSDKPYVCIGVEGLSEYKQCIPYEGNEYLLGSSEECEEFYKTW